MTKSIRVMRRPGEWDYPVQNIWMTPGINHWSIRASDYTEEEEVESLPVRTYRMDRKFDGFKYIATSGSGPTRIDRFGYPTYMFQANSNSIVDMWQLDFQGRLHSFVYSVVFMVGGYFTSGQQYITSHGDMDLSAVVSPGI